ncbi:hypothetical protein MX939_000234 [Escherichia coli]|nr:hypothetical protein [Escherichia coli]EJC1899574.1 hypothetical protein [Escherichia coli]MBB8075793.1 hypothetical protein [Escherichia coli]VTR16079.1 Uncharacterised protein [Escherichia coli]HAI2272194.1 hypothetical protein [Escherichia coli]HBC9177082.1 hypothetical protein [Escherichia coli]
MEKDLKELREYLLLTPDYPESNDCQVNLSTEDVTNEEISERLGIVPGWITSTPANLSDAERAFAGRVSLFPVGLYIPSNCLLIVLTQI